MNWHTCRLWRERFVAAGAQSLWAVAEGRGRKPQPGLAERIVKATLSSKPPGQTHWSTRAMARAQGVDASTVCRIWQEHGLQPHRQETFKLSRDPQFVPKLLDVVGVYLHPPQNAVVLCVDEKSQIQALDRTQPGLPMKGGRCGTWTHDYVRHGTTTLFAALNVAAGTVSGRCFPRHRHQEFLRFLRQIDAEYAPELDLHLVLDNYGTHKTAQVQRWVRRSDRQSRAPWQLCQCPGLGGRDRGLHCGLELRSQALYLAGASRRYPRQDRALSAAAGRDLARLHRASYAKEGSVTCV